jgi:hypothetical protein
MALDGQHWKEIQQLLKLHRPCLKVGHSECSKTEYVWTLCHSGDETSSLLTLHELSHLQPGSFFLADFRFLRQNLIIA